MGFQSLVICYVGVGTAKNGLPWEQNMPHKQGCSFFLPRLQKAAQSHRLIVLDAYYLLN